MIHSHLAPSFPPHHSRSPGAHALRVGAELSLHGVNIYLDYLRFDDLALMATLLPGSNLVRLVALFWGDVKPDAGTDMSVSCAPDDTCCVDDAASSFIADRSEGPRSLILLWAGDWRAMRGGCARVAERPRERCGLSGASTPSVTLYEVVNREKSFIEWLFRRRFKCLPIRNAPN